jgi:hypothetical protein
MHVTGPVPLASEEILKFLGVFEECWQYLGSRFCPRNNIRNSFECAVHVSPFSMRGVVVNSHGCGLLTPGIWHLSIICMEL